MSAKSLDELRMVDPVLTTLAMGFSNPSLIADKIFPIIDVSKQKGKVPVFGKESFAVRDTERGIRSASNRVPPPGTSLVSFETKEHDIETAIDYLEAQEADSDLKYEQKIAKDLMDVLLLGREKEVADYLQEPANYATANKTVLTAANAFSAYDSVVSPLTIVNAARVAFRNRIAKYPNVMLMGAKTYQALINHPILTNLIKYSDFPTIDTAKLCQLFGVDEVLVGNAVYTDDNATFNDVWGDNLLLAYVDKSDSPSEFNPSCGYVFRREGLPEIDTYYENGGKIKVIRCTDNYGIKVTSPDALHLISNTCLAA